jgi:hypothetical protein
MNGFVDLMETIERDVQVFGFLTPSAHDRLMAIMSAAPEQDLRHKAGLLLIGYEVLGGLEVTCH